jgi:hypothetical protein
VRAHITVARILDPAGLIDGDGCGLPSWCRCQQRRSLGLIRRNGERRAICWSGSAIGPGGKYEAHPS